MPAASSQALTGRRADRERWLMLTELRCPQQRRYMHGVPSVPAFMAREDGDDSNHSVQRRRPPVRLLD